MNLRRTLRTLILCEVALIVLSIAQAQLGQGLLPIELQHYERAQEGRDLSTADWASLGLAVPAVILLVIGWVGLWRLWPRARAIYTSAWALSLIVAALTGATVSSWLGQLLGDLAALVAGVIFGITYFSELRHHFRPREQASKAQAA